MLMVNVCIHVCSEDKRVKRREKEFTNKKKISANIKLIILPLIVI